MSPFRLSNLLDNFTVEAPDCSGSKEFARINGAMHRGNTLRLNSQRGEFLALAVAREIYDGRPPGEDQVLRRRVHVIQSLEHPDEVRALRRSYGNGCYLLGLIVDEEERRKHLRDDCGCTFDEVEKLFQRDEHEEDPRFFHDGRNHGQRTRDTFHLADAFLPLNDEDQLKGFSP